MRAQQIFVETLPIIGEVPMVFYLPPSKDKADLKLLIEKHGGLISDFHECFTYQIAPITENVQKVQYFWGHVFTGHWIVESVKEGELLPNDQYYAFHNEEKLSKRIDFTEGKVNYTLTEGIKIFEIALANQSENRTRGSAFWLQIQREKLVPNRPGESMRNFWKKNSNRGLEEFLSRSVSDDTRYCHAFKQIPQPQAQSLGTLYEQARMRLFEAASIPVEQIRYDDNQTRSMLRSAAAQKKAEGKDIIDGIFSRMAKVKPVNNSWQSAAKGQNLEAANQNQVSTRQQQNDDEQMTSEQQNGGNTEVEQVIVGGANDAEMQDEEANKENNAAAYQNINANSQDLLDMVDSKGIQVRDKTTLKPVEISTGQEAYFALLAQDMLNIANHYEKSIEEVHKIFYEVSCDRDRLIQACKEDKQRASNKPVTVEVVPRWQTLEDLALRHDESTPSYQVVLKDKGIDEVNKRKAFLDFAQA